MSHRLDDARNIALRAMIDGVERLIASDSPVRRLPIGWRGGDATCDVIGDQMMGEGCGIVGEREDLDLYITTQVYAGGGHTAVIGDLIGASEVGRAEVLVTGTVERDVHKRGMPGEIVERLGIGERALAVCPYEDPVAATRWVMGEICERRPRRVFLFHHPQDAVAITAARPDLCGELFLVHHADRQPTLGLHQRDTRLIDLSPFTSEFTRRVLGMKSSYLPLTVADPGERELCNPVRPITTASSGAAHKFGECYAGNIARVLGVTGGKHIHFGFLKDKRLEGIRGHLESWGIDAGRFEYVEWVPSLARALVDREVGLCIGSAPMGGARTTIEAAAAGVPMLAHLPDFSTAFGVSHLTPESWPKWRNAGDLVALIQGADDGWLEEQGRIGYAHFLKNHHPDRLRAAMSDLENSVLPAREDLPLAELIDVEKIKRVLRGEWAFLGGEFAEGVLDTSCGEPGSLPEAF